MGKNIVLCLDGTWNGPDTRSTDGRATPTNVQKVFESLQGSAPLAATDNEKEISAAADGAFPAQAAKYIHGVGNADNFIASVCEGAVGIGLVARIIRGYTYLSRNYEQGDNIYIAGFSRGAYTARALAGFVVHQGLLDWQAMQLKEGAPESYSAGLAAWGKYKATLNAGNRSILHGLAMAITDLHDKFEEGLHPAPALHFVENVPVQAVGVWDTVGALGIPDVQERDGTEVRADVFEFADNQLSSKVKYGFHAVAADEQRVDFTPTLWDVREGVTQFLFPGAHAGVGYPETESGLANGALTWMARRLASVGVRFEQLPLGVPDPLALQHRPWSTGSVPYKTAYRQFPPGLTLSQRILQRMAGGAVPVEGLKDALYRPKNLMNSYVLLDGSGPAPHVEVGA